MKMSRWAIQTVDTSDEKNKTIVTMLDGTKTKNRYEFVEFDNDMSMSWIFFDKINKSIVQIFDIKKVEIETKMEIDVEFYRESKNGYSSHIFYKKTVTRKYPVVEKFRAGKDFSCEGMPSYEEIEIVHPEQIRD